MERNQSINKSENKIRIDGFCCDIMKDLSSKLTWFKIEGEETYVMPCFETSSKPQVRLNYCPSCGSYVRNIKIKK